MSKNVIVTGAGQGIGRCSVERFLDHGWRVAAMVRDVDAARAIYGERDDLAIIRMDLREADRIPGAMADAAGFLGRVDCMVNNAGHALMGAADDTDFDTVREMFQTNFFGAAEATACVLPSMRAQGDGAVVCVSSIGARLSNPLLGYYHATKYAMTAWAEAMRVETGRSGIRVHMIEPGMVNTDFPKATRITGSLATGGGDYDELFGQLRAGFGAWRASDGATDGPTVARAVVAAAEDPSTPFRVPVGGDADQMADARKRLGDDDFHRWICDFLTLDADPRTS